MLPELLCAGLCDTMFTSAAHLYEQFLHVQQLGLSHLDAYVMRRGGCLLELYYSNMVEWFWWDGSLISMTIWFNRA